MTQTNITELCQGWFRYYRQREVQDYDINVGGLTQKVSVEYYNERLQEKIITRQADITTTDQSLPGPKGQVHSSKNSGDSVIVLIEDGFIEGLHKFVKMPLSMKNKEIKQHFGWYIEFDANKPESVIHKKLQLDVAMEHNLGPRGSTAVISYKEKVYTVSFTCKICLQGGVAMRDGDGVLEGELKEIVKLFNGQCDSLTMTGQLVFCWESDHSLHWQNM